MPRLLVADLGTVPYAEALELQRAVARARISGEVADDVLLLVEHPPVITLGRGTKAGNLLASPGLLAARGVELFEVDRGGDVTFHGPGQLVAYPIVRLPEHVLVVDFVRRLEEAMIATCADFGVTTARVPGRSGVWLRADELRQERKVGAIGLRVSQGVTMHGIALNCDVDLGWYDRFVPCGIADAGVTTLSLETGSRIGVPEALPVLQHRLTELLAWQPYVATPDYDRRPDPAKQPRIELVRP